MGGSWLSESWIDSWNSIERIASLKDIPMFFMTGASDIIIPPSQTRELLAAHGENSEFHIFPDGQHWDMKLQPNYYGRVNSWLEDRIRAERTSGK